MKATTPSLPGPGSTQEALDEILKMGAKKLLIQAIEAEVAAYIDAHKDQLDEHGHRLVVRNGLGKKRSLDTGVGRLEIMQPRVDDRRDGHRFSSKILPPYLRRTKKLEDLIPWLYLRGISTGDFSECLQQLTGDSSASLSPTSVVRLKESWIQECDAWSRRSLEDKRYVYFWVDGVHFNIRLEEDRQCILVIMGATEDGHKELIAVHDGFRESADSWREILIDLRERGLVDPPALAVGDGALGFWKALAEVYPQTRGQRCWVHKTANVLNKLPKRKQEAAKAALHQIWMADTRDDAHQAFDRFVAKYEAKYSSAVECLDKDRDELLAFYDFPAQHWKHLRTTNPIESLFATVRLRHRRTKGSGSRAACFAMVFKLAEAASRTWRRLRGYKLVRDVIRGVQFKDGIKVEDAA
ncbi:MAG: IS256 family transposase [Planctomycetes bacterium]|nr:IS256 family transposase [Planctomycetota bacterium]MCB9919628.1 IS256 family transposase [Planctomycetota bacterium]MCB9920117.1 IS256 family transposase [Planctomycetota bacterium]